MINSNVFLNSIYCFKPEIILLVFGLSILLIDLINKELSDKVIPLLSVTGLVLSLYLVLKDINTGTVVLFVEMIRLDSFARFFKLLLLVSATFVTISLINTREMTKMARAETFALIQFMTIGMMLMVSSINWIMIVISIELTGITGYILTGFIKGDKSSGEGAYKYVFYGASATGISLYGISLLYGITHTLNIYEMSSVFKQLIVNGQGNQFLAAAFVALVFVLAGIGYKISMVPFHMWTPDVYEGAPVPVAGFLAVASKSAGFAVLIRVLFSVFSVNDGHSGKWLILRGLSWQHLIGIAAFLTMTWGNLAALSQNNLKRLLAYSSIAHAGYMLLAFTSVNREGISAVLLYLFFYLFMNLGAFIAVSALSSVVKSEDINNYKGIGPKFPVTAVFFSICLFSLTGLPPFAGFVGKFYIFIAILRQQTLSGALLAVAAIINTVISLYYYLGIVKVMFIDKPNEEISFTKSVPGLQIFSLGLLTIPVIIFGVWWEPALRLVKNSLNFY